jgi:hypothetical protein
VLFNLILMFRDEQRVHPSCLTRPFSDFGQCKATWLTITPMGVRLIEEDISCGHRIDEQRSQ